MLCCNAVRAQGTEYAVSSFTAGLDSVVDRLLPRGGNVGIAVYDLTADLPVYRHRADRNCRPASTMKLVTAIAALSLPRSDEPFRTEIWHTGSINDSILHGDLYVVGGFDPEFDEEDMDAMIGAVAALPVKKIEGRILGDVSMKDSLYFGSGWLWDDNPESYQPYLSPLMLNKGVVHITVTPNAAGTKATVEATPRSTYYSVVNNTVSRSPQAGIFKLTRDWMHNRNELTVSGNVTSRRSADINVHSSADMFMHTFVDKLQLAGIECDGSYGFDTLGVDAQPVAVCETSMKDVLERMMKESDNLNAEAMLYRMAAQKSGAKYACADDGLEVARGIVRSVGLNPRDYKMADGCGLSMYDYLSPDLLVAFLKYAYADKSIYDRLYPSLPIGGVDGTLEYRMRSGTPSYRRVHAKTGTYTGISCLAGYLTTRSGKLIAFSIMNQNQTVARDARTLQDSVCDYIVRHY